MPRFLCVLAAVLSLLSAAPVRSQETDSIFADDATFHSFVDGHIARRDFIPLIQRLGGRDEYTAEQLNGLQQQFLAIYPADFTHRATVRTRLLENGFREEIVGYWTGLAYIWFYAITHQRDDGVVVISFALNSNYDQVAARF
ncbi:hypothetical protein [Actibacterium sp. MT2.3-13A]|uniref:hypothetical protein n=1 Tax=Actibacterium sp. MT2.3-13A TaxID=2828332 RepID=UPI001BA52D8A|nr:hypothetical protein [Actibacterium sp. MT2.3-13A]